MDTEKLLAGLFDFQRFERSPALQRVIDGVETRYFGEELTDDALKNISAAGDPFLQMPDPRKRDGPL
jgi:hypothetical protein